MPNYVNILNTIRANASEEYQNRVPEATRDNITNVGNPITTYDTVTNEFLSILINRIVRTMVTNKRFNNPLAKFKGSELPFGYSQQNIHTNPTKAEHFTESIGETLLKKSLPDTKVEYFNLNRQDTYPVTISEDSLSLAFTSGDELGTFIDSIFNAMYSGDALDEFNLMKTLFSNAVKDEKINVLEIADPTASDTNTKEFVKLLQTYFGLFKFPSANFNKYASVKNDGTNVVTWCDPEDILILMPSTVLPSINVDVLMTAFNMEKAKILNNIIEIDTFDDPSIQAVICDRHVLKVNDSKFKIKSFENGKGLYWNYFLHHWQTLSLSLFANCVAFRTPTTTP